MLQVGRSSESPIDFVVMDTVPGNKVQDPGKAAAQSTISRYSPVQHWLRDMTDI